EMSTISKPIPAFFRYLATFGVINFDPTAHLVLDSLKHTHTAHRIIAVTTEMHLRGIWTNHRDRTQRTRIQRQKIVVVLQQSNRASRRFCRERSVFRRIRDAHSALDVNIRILKQAEQKLCAQVSCYRLVDCSLRNLAVFHEL